MLCIDDCKASLTLYIGVPNIPCISPSQSQEFNMTIIRHVGYYWDDTLKVYFYKMKGSGKVIYNYDDPTEIWYKFCS